MPMVPVKLAADIAKALKGPVTPEITGIADALVATVKTGVFTHAAIVGVAPPGGPLQNGGAEAGVIVLPSAASLPGLLASALKGPPTPQITGMANGFATHFQTALVSFKPGTIVGSCANTPIAPGPVVAAGQGGTVMGLDGMALSGLWEGFLGGTSLNIKEMAAAVATYFTTAAGASYIMGSVSGLAPPAGGPIAGAGAGGIFA